MKTLIRYIYFITYISFSIVCVLSDDSSPANNNNKTDIHANIAATLAETDSKVTVESCGRRKIYHTELIVNDANTKPGDWPWHAAIYTVNKDTAKYICGGTLLSKVLVLTAAHCVTIQSDPVLPDILNVVFGKFNLYGGDIESQERMVNEVIVHELFTRKEIKHDIALLKLKSQVKFGDYVQPACLWYPAAVNKLPTSEIRGTVVGWGFDQTNSLSNQLRQASMPVQTEATCIRSNPIFYSKFLNNFTFCAGLNNGTSACNGDSGGGFHVFVPDLSAYSTDYTSGAWYAYGVVSLSVSQPHIPVCDPTQFVVYTKISEYREWIINNGDLDGYVSRTEVSEQKNSCGRRNIYETGVEDSVETERGDWPWHAAIYRIYKDKSQYSCGGTLISKTIVLTAAHCAVLKGKPISPWRLTVILGKYNMKDRELENQERLVKEVIVHELFDSAKLKNDIALLKLQYEVLFGRFVQPTCLWNPAVIDKLPNKEIKGTVVGWGQGIDNFMIPTLRQTTIPKQSDLTCIRSNPEYYINNLDENKFCAGYDNGTLLYRGYTGGGFHVFVPDMINNTFVKTSGTWYIYGILFSCVGINDNATCIQFALFTEISKYTDWIIKYVN